MLATLKTKNQITLPSKIIKKIGLHVKDQLDININDCGEIVLTPVIVEILPINMIKDL
ncbi:MAG: AbrB/MazE/SpoVT family DNA-binding domain-containing protein [Bacillota bacterium]|nr:AbrB/MazE/SpoVT family DNA-binding domain-containing protein [Bacillota bacterium]